MAIKFSCACGRVISVKDEYAGKKGKCPACGAVMTVPMPAAAGVSAGGAARSRNAAPPIDDDTYDVRDDDPPRLDINDAGIELGGAITPMPYNPTSRAAATASRATAAGTPAGMQLPGMARHPVQQQPSGKGGGIGSRFAISGYFLFAAVSIVVIPIVIWLIATGPVRAVKEWGKAQDAGENDVTSTMNLIIAKMDEATMRKPEPGEELDGVPYHPSVTKFYFVDNPSVMWRMPDMVPFEGATTFGKYEGEYFTRKREVVGTMEWKAGHKLQVKSKCDENDNVVSLTVDDIDINDAAALKKKYGAGY